MNKIPTLETERLRLRPQRMEDWPQYLALMSSDRAMYMGGPFNLSTAWGLFCHDLAQWSLFGHGALMIEDKAAGETLGQVGINAGPLFPETELGWLVYPEAEGKGIAFEAAQTLRNWAFADLGAKTLVSYIDPPNIRSRKLAERLGAVIDPSAKRQDPDDIVYRHLP
ncbi:MAG: GNAT family N-acetyltransferase [Pikeienuella sp.]